MTNRLEFSAELAESICKRIAAGESFHSICTESGMPDLQRIVASFSADELFRLRLQQAVSSRNESLEQQVLTSTTIYPKRSALNTMLAAKWVRATLPSAAELEESQKITRIELVPFSAVDRHI